ncbi:MAG: hypothetical protein R3330_05740, partial [Saprospiraceae bacterium]|nr:hypothetical protein [Saprospiraceae bacterium]
PIEVQQPLVMVMHHVVWGDVEAAMNTYAAANANRPGFSFLCSSPYRFASEIYPRLAGHAASGGQVYVISGDGGQYKKSYAYQSTDGVQFLITGINNSVDTTLFTPGRPFNFDPDSILLLTNDHGQLSHQFVRLDEWVDQ